MLHRRVECLTTMPRAGVSKHAGSSRCGGTENIFAVCAYRKLSSAFGGVWPQRGVLPVLRNWLEAHRSIAVPIGDTPPFSSRARCVTLSIAVRSQSEKPLLPTHPPISPQPPTGHGAP